MYEIQIFDGRVKRLAWDNVTAEIRGINAAERMLLEHEEDWPNCQFRIMRAEGL